MSQNLNIGCSFMSKNGKIFVIFHDYFSTFHKIKTRTLIKDLRHGSLHINVFFKYVKFCVWKIDIKRDISV